MNSSGVERWIVDNRVKISSSPACSLVMNEAGMLLAAGFSNGDILVMSDDSRIDWREPILLPEDTQGL
nr:hypothetical protein [Candidatus Sigynarchaeota archaeon]